MASNPYTVKRLLKHKHTTVTRIELHPGHETEKHTHEHDTVVHPRETTTLLKTTFRGDEVVGTEQIEHKADKPYVVGKSEDGTSFTIKNIGSTLMLCEKTALPPKG